MSVPLNLRLNAANPFATILFQAPIQFDNSVHAQAVEANFPWRSPPLVTITGMRYVRDFPIDFFKLCLRRLPVMVGLESDWWLVESNTVRNLERLGLPKLQSRILLVTLQLIALGALFVSVFFKLLRKNTAFDSRNVIDFFSLVFVYFCVGMVPQFLTGASTRFWVPFIPFFCISISTSIFINFDRFRSSNSSKTFEDRVK